MEFKDFIANYMKFLFFVSL